MTISATSTNFAGATVELGTFSLNPASINANSEGTTTVTVTGAKVGDIIIVSAPSALDAGLVPKGATVTATDTVSVVLANVTGSGVDGSARTWAYQLVHLS